MKYCFGILIFLGMLSVNSLRAQPQSWLWAHSGGGKGADQTSSMATDSAGNLFVTGYYADSAIFSDISIGSRKGNHFFLAKYSKEGILLWIKTTGFAAGQSQGTGITIGKNDYLYITGYFYDSLALDKIILTSSGNEDVFLAKYDLEGDLQWAVSGGGPGYNLSRSLSTDKISGNIYIAGSFSGTAHFGGKEIKSKGGDDIFLISYNSSGSVVWAKNFGSVKDDAGFGVTCSNSGDVVLTGTFSDTADIGGKKLIAKGRTDIFIAKYSSEGDLRWAEQAGDTTYGDKPAVVMDEAENVYVTGRFYFDAPGAVPGCDGIGNIYIAKYNKTGVKQWMKCAGNGGEESGDAIVVDSSGYIYVTGGYDYTINFGSGKILNSGLIDAFIVKFNADGVAQWTDRAGGSGDDYGTSLALDRTGNIFLGGAFSDTAAFGPFSLISNHLKDAFVVKFGTQASVSAFSPAHAHISLYPNPAKTEIAIESANNSRNSAITVEVIDILGKTLKRELFFTEDLRRSIFTLFVNELPKGIYFCRVSTNAWRESRMFVLQ